MSKRLLIYTFLALAFVQFSHAQTTKEQASNSVKAFYKGLQQTVDIDINDLYRHRDQKIIPYLISPDVFQHPNEWMRMAPDLAAVGNSILINTHLGNLYQMGHERHLRMDYSICDVSELQEVQLEKKTLKEKVVVTYWELTVRKQYALDNRTFTFMDTVDVKIENGKIAMIINDVYCQDRAKPKNDNLKDHKAWHHEQVTRAARYWSQGRKREAYQAYVDAVENYEDRDVYFTIGILLHNHYKECTNLKKKQARDLAYTYFYKAYKSGHPDAWRVMDYWWDKKGHSI